MTEPTSMFEGPGPEKVYQEALRRGEFQIQHCGGCARHVFFPRVICPHCGSPNLSWVKPSGKGTVYSTIVVRRKPDAGGDINVALIDLEEGVRMMSRVDGLPPEQVRIGMAVQASVIDGKEQPLVVFAPEGGAQ